MRVAFRADASGTIGAGHVMRCATLAADLVNRGAEVLFVCRMMPGDYCDWLEHNGFRVRCLANSVSSIEDDADNTRRALEEIGGADWLVVDHYALDSRWERGMRAVASRNMVIDDLADRPHDAHLLLDQNLIADAESRYEQWIAPDCIRLLGPRYALLRPQFALARQKLRPRDGSVRRILVFFGGGDCGLEIGKTLQALVRLNLSDVTVDVVCGRTDQVVLKQFVAELPHATIRDHVDDVAALMVSADLAIGASGSTTWERCCVGLPSVTVSRAPNQEPIGKAVGDVGAARHLGRSTNVSASEIERAIGELLNAPDELAQMSMRGMSLVDGCGASRVADTMERS